jgi:predicted GH43/DUF377 family glycosyl hydrolase
MEIGVKHSQDVIIHPESGKDTRAEMSLAVRMARKHLFEAAYREVHQNNNSGIYESVLCYATSENGIDFMRSGTLVVPPGPKENRNIFAVEDPTLIFYNEEMNMFYTEVKSDEKWGYKTSIACITGKDLNNLDQTIRKVVLTPEEVSKALRVEIQMVKEPEFYQDQQGLWHIVYEFSDGITSRIGTAVSRYLTGPYINHRLLIDVRPGKWDDQHVSTGAIIPGKDILLLYNGRGERNSLDHTPEWACGCVAIDKETGGIIEGTRSEEPFYRSRPEIGEGGQIIAFLNSISQIKKRQIDTDAKCYITIGDKRSEMATLAVNGFFG